MYFLLRPYTSANAFASEYEMALSTGECMATSSQASAKDIILDTSDPEKWDQVKTITHNFTKSDAGLYFLTWQRCEPAGDQHPATFSFTHHMYNSDKNGKTDYLSTGDAPLPTLFLLFGFAYLALSGIWYKVIRTAKAEEGGGTGISPRGLVVGNQSAPKVHHIHYLMLLLIILKTLAIFAESAKYHYIRWTGSGEAWSIIYYFFEFIKGMMLFLVILLIGSGWSFVKPFLNEREKKIVLFVLVLQVLDNIAIAVVSSDEPGTSSYVSITKKPHPSHSSLLLFFQYSLFVCVSNNIIQPHITTLLSIVF